MNSRNDINSLSEDVVSPQEFLNLWTPFEMEIGWLTSPLPREHITDESAEAQRLEKVLRQRRELLERVLAEAEAGDSAAQEVFHALELVMRLYAARVVKIASMAPAGQGSASTRGLHSQEALAQLSQEADFLRYATAYATRLQNWVLDAAENGRLDVAHPAERKPLAPRPRLLPAELLFFNDAVHATAVKALSRASEWEPMEGFAFAFRQSYDKSSITIGLPTGESSAGLWDYLRRGGPRMVKAHYALWARYYHDVDEGGLSFAVVHLSQFCADIGLKKHKNGGYRREQKQDALKMLHALTSVVMSAEKTLGRKLFRVRGPLWTRGLEAESRDFFGGDEPSGGANAWEPVAFSFAPGPWFHDPDWRRYHRYVGKVGIGLLQLDNREEWAILVGGYIAMLGRSNAYRPLRLKVDTILEEAGLVQSADARRRHAENRAKFETALDRLAAAEIGVIAAWRYLGMEMPREPDMDDAASIVEYSQVSSEPAGAWREWMVEIDLPFEVERERLQTQRSKALQGKKEKTAKKANEDVSASQPAIVASLPKKTTSTKKTTRRKKTEEEQLVLPGS